MMLLYILIIFPIYSVESKCAFNEPKRHALKKPGDYFKLIVTSHLLTVADRDITFVDINTLSATKYANEQ